MKKIKSFFGFIAPIVTVVENTTHHQGQLFLNAGKLISCHNEDGCIIGKIKVQSNNIENLNKPIRIDSGTYLTFDLEPSSTTTITIYPRNTFWQTINKYFQRWKS